MMSTTGSTGQQVLRTALLAILCVALQIHFVEPSLKRNNAASCSVSLFPIILINGCFWILMRWNSHQVQSSTWCLTSNMSFGRSLRWLQQPEKPGVWYTSACHLAVIGFCENCYSVISVHHHNAHVSTKLAWTLWTSNAEGIMAFRHAVMALQGFPKFALADIIGCPCSSHNVPYQWFKILDLNNQVMDSFSQWLPA